MTLRKRHLSLGVCISLCFTSALLFQNFTVAPSDSDFHHIINVATDFGAIPNDKDDDTEEIRKASDYAKSLLLENNKAKIAVVFPVGTYLVSPLNSKFQVKTIPFYSGISYIGDSDELHGKKATLTVLPSPCLKYQDTDKDTFDRCHKANKWGRMVNGIFVSPNPLVIKNMNFYGSRNSQGPHASYELEQKSLLFLRGTIAQSLKVEISDSDFHESPGDGVQIYSNVDIQIKRMKANFNFRGGVTITGGKVNADIDHYMSWGDARPFMSLQIEIDPHGEKDLEGKKLLTNNIKLTNARMNGIFDLGFAGDNSTFYGDKIIMYGGQFLYAGINAKSHVLKTTGLIKNSILRTVSGNDKGNTYDSGHIYAPGDLTFENVQFYAQGKKNLETTAMHIRFYNSYAYYENQQVKFKNCRFKIYGEEASLSSVIKMDPVKTGSHNKVILEQSIVYPGFKYIFQADRGGVIEANGVSSYAAEVFRTGSLKGYSLHLDIRNFIQRLTGLTSLGRISGMANSADYVSISSSGFSGKEVAKTGAKIKKRVSLEGTLRKISYQQ
ncbi:hypothetical protein [Pseudobdellovibrio sp. HCB154]|uniref:hypothetical protein n=1 Tax=Pseudobdellovibrio sp. HCB154 TaxID=3386277 RepID=UPI003917362B